MVCSRWLFVSVALLGCVLACSGAKRRPVDGGDAGERDAPTDSGVETDAADARDGSAPPDEPEPSDPPPVIRSRSAAQTGRGAPQPPVIKPECPQPPPGDLQELEHLLLSPANDPTTVISALGRTLALDDETLALSAIREDAAGTRWVVLVFAHDGDAWTLQAMLEPPDDELDSTFGASLALDGDTLAIATPTLRDSHGRVHVFQRDAGEWQLDETLSAAVPVDGDRFGAHLALDGNTLAASMDQQLGVVVEVFVRDDRGWSREQGLVPLGMAIGDTPLLGLALDGDILAFGARQSTNDDRQAVHVFERLGGTWEPVVRLFGDNPDELFGAALALQGQTLIVGDPQRGIDDAAAASAPPGAAFVFQRDLEGVWTQEGFLQASHPATGAGFGAAVAIDCDRIVVGNPMDRTAARGIDGEIGVSTDIDDDSGAVYVFGPASAGYELRDYVKSTTDARRQKRFGHRVAANAGRVLIGTGGEEAAYLFR